MMQVSRKLAPDDYLQVGYTVPIDPYTNTRIKLNVTLVASMVGCLIPLVIIG